MTRLKLSRDSHPGITRPYTLRIYREDDFYLHMLIQLSLLVPWKVSFSSLTQHDLEFGCDRVAPHNKPSCI
jgi:hypothetical protein